MKKTMLFLIGSILVYAMPAQVPQGISHQAVIRNADNELVANSSIGIQVSILQGSIAGDAVYVETHSLTSNANGLITYVIGEGEVESGVFAAIDWSAGPYFLKTEADPTGGTDYSISGVTQFLTVPYALFAQRVAEGAPTNIYPPWVIASEASGVENNAATLNGIVNGRGFLTHVYFHWGTDMDYGNVLPATESPVTGSENVAVSATLTDLLPATTYHFRIKASNAVNVVYSDNLSFTTTASLPIITTKPVTHITPVSAISGGIISSDGGSPIMEKGLVWSTSMHPDTDENEGISFAGEGSDHFNTTLSGLLPATTYYVRAYASNEQGTAYGNQLAFTTGDGFPGCVTLQASGIESTSALLNAAVNPNHSLTNVYFEYGQSMDYTHNVPAEPASAEGNHYFSVSAAIDDLEPGTVYHYRVVAENDMGECHGDDATFFTPGSIVDIDGNIYQTIMINGLEWMTENLRVTKYRDGSDIQPASSLKSWETTTEGAFAVYPHEIVEGIDSEAQMAEAYGILYNWFAVDDASGLCPAGWRMPDEEEVSAMLEYIITNYDEIEMDNAGNRLKSCRQLASQLGGECDTPDHPRWNAHITHYGTDEFGFSGLPAGFKSQSGDFLNIGIFGNWWSASEYSVIDAYYFHMSNNYGGVVKINYDKRMGLSVRCVRAAATPTLYMLSIIVEPAEGGEVTGAGTYEHGAAVTVTATPNPGYHFQRWESPEGAIISLEPAFVFEMPEEDVVLIAIFTPLPWPVVSTALISVTEDPASVFSGGYVSDDGGSVVISRGVCWSTEPLPTLEDNHTLDGSGTGPFTSHITGLAPATTYYIRAYATNLHGTSYGNQQVHTTAQLAVGNYYGGGIVAYLLQPHDAGYDPDQQKGIIVANLEFEEAPWGCSAISIDGTSIMLGTGSTNTSLIVENCTEENIAALVCNNLEINGYDDWYLPSLHELQMLHQYLHLNGLGGFDDAEYWSSSQIDHFQAWTFSFEWGSGSFQQKNNAKRIRAIRSF